MTGRFGPREFFAALDSNLGMKFALTGLMIPCWIMPLACFIVAGVPERIIVPILLVGLLPFQYLCFCAIQVLHRPRIDKSHEIIQHLFANWDVHPDVAAAISAIGRQANALLSEVEKQRVTLSQEQATAALMATWWGGVDHAKAIRQQQAATERFSVMLDQIHRARAVPSSAAQSQTWLPPRPPIVAGARS